MVLLYKLSALPPFDTAVSIRPSSHLHLLVVARQLSLGIILSLRYDMDAGYNVPPPGTTLMSRRTMLVGHVITTS
jgi:hypothetical protein